MYSCSCFTLDVSTSICIIHLLTLRRLTSYVVLMLHGQLLTCFAGICYRHLLRRTSLRRTLLYISCWHPLAVNTTSLSNTTTLLIIITTTIIPTITTLCHSRFCVGKRVRGLVNTPVSYTHLTLPTKRIV